MSARRSALHLLTLASITVLGGCQSPARHVAALLPSTELIHLHDTINSSTSDRATLYTSAIIAAAGPFDVALPSWNIDAPPEASFVVELRARSVTGAWSRWLHIGDWGDAVPPRAARTTKCLLGRVDVDVFTAVAPCDAVQLRVRAAGEMAAPLHIRRLVISLRRSEQQPDAGPWPISAEAVRLDVPFRNQVTGRTELLGRICNPASVAMLLTWHGLDTPVEVVAERCHDAAHDIYGGWPRAVQAAYTLGLPGYIHHLTTWGELRDHLAAGRPLVASIRVTRDYPELPYGAIGGHIVVITGLDAAGNVYLNDPAFTDAAKGQFRVPRAVMQEIWLRPGGVTYIFDSPRTAARPRHEGD